MERTAIILSGGLGTRLRPFTNIMPKPLLPIGEKAVLEIQIEQLKNCGFTDIYLATNYKSDYIEKFFGDGSYYGVNLYISKEDKPLGTVGPVKLLEDKLKKPFLVMNGDILTDLDFDELYQFGVNQESQLTVSIKKMIMPFRFGNIDFEGDIVTNIVEKPDIVTYALAGIYIMKPEILNRIPAGEMYNMDALIKGMLNSGTPISKYELDNYWLDIGCDEDYKKAQEIFK
ncbi:MAG: NTP transferase domain-containing protein [Lachnospiraceae bacterium]|nr:NTP transferase domain-containing protein [Lachnospiraceae bacterium]